jgi:hypothetical protein
MKKFAAIFLIMLLFQLAEYYFLGIFDVVTFTSQPVRPAFNAVASERQMKQQTIFTSCVVDFCIVAISFVVAHSLCDKPKHQ